MIWMAPTRCMVYMCSPKLRSLRELEEHGMHLSDIAPHDTTRDLILLNQQRLAEMELSTQLERKKEELRVLSRHLAAEKKKTETLLYAMLPEHVANQLKEGEKVAAGGALLPGDQEVRGLALKPGGAGFELWCHRLLATWSWADYLCCTSLVFSLH